MPCRPWPPARTPILVVGDSLSAEYGLKRGTGWVPLLEKRLASEKLARHGGQRQHQRRHDFRRPFAAARPARSSTSPTILVLELGGNDALRGLPLAMTEENLSQMTQAAQKAGARVLLVGIQVPPNYGADYASRFAGLFAKVAKAAQGGGGALHAQGRGRRPGARPACSRPTASTRPRQRSP